MESSSGDGYGEPFSEEEDVNNGKNDDVDDDNGPVDQVVPIDYGLDDDYIGDDQFTLYTCRDVYILKGWRAYVLERRSCSDFLVPEPPVPERLVLVLRAISGLNWQKAVLAPENVILNLYQQKLLGFL